LPSKKKPVGSCWIYKIKYKSDSSIERYKTCLVVQGYIQIEGLVYTKTFTPIVKLTIIKYLLVITITAAQNLELHQLDVNNVFLYSELHEKVYISPPPSYLSPGDTHVCQLHKSLYGLK